MKMTRIALLPLVLGLALSACATPAESGGQADAEAPPPADLPVAAAPAPSNDREPAMTCNAKAAQFAVGQLADEAVVARAKAESGSERVRVIKPGMAVTMDYREDRLNIDVDADNRVTGVRCG